MDARETFIARAWDVARETGWNAVDHAREHGWPKVGLGPVGQHRDSDALAQSNFRVIRDDLTERFGDAIGTVSFGHWGVGWIEEISFDASRDDVCDAVEQWETALADYPVASESDYSELEREELEAYCRTMPSFVERDGIEYETPRPMSADDVADAFAHIAFETLQVSRADDVREEALIDAAIDAGLYVPDVDSVRERLGELQHELDNVRDRLADFGRGIVDARELLGAA